VNGLLSGLLPIGLREREIVAWLGLNTPLQLQLLDACIARGAVLMPLNWRLAPAELAAQLRHAGATHLLHDPAMPTSPRLCGRRWRHRARPTASRRAMRCWSTPAAPRANPRVRCTPWPASRPTWRRRSTRKG
jgi:hypothetical protein